jgi:carbamoyltransferase
MDESPFMMYAVNLTAAKIGQLPAITHVDGTCRVQTVKRTDNPAYYDVINAFYDLTGVPVVFNTSFNLAGEPLVETVADAVHTLQNCDINYMYMPTIKKLLVKQG